MLKTLHIAWVLLFALMAGTSAGQTVLFSEDFGSSTTGWYQSSSPNWDCRHSSANDWSTGLAPCGSTYERAYVLNGIGYYITTKEITLGASGNQLSFDYSFDYYSSSSPEVRVLSGSCGSSGTDITSGTLVTSTCDNVSFSLDAYANQTIRLVFYSNTSSEPFYFDNVEVITGGGGGGTTGSDLKWADTFNDGDTDLDFAGNDGDEDFSGASWSIETASLTGPFSSTVNFNKTEAFPDSETQGYSVQVDKDEYFESPTIDLSAQEGIKISFYVKKAGGGLTDWIGSHVYLQIWDGSSWVQVLSLGGSSGDDEDMVDSGFGYHCFTAYKSSSSPGNYYYSAFPNVMSDYFHSDFKFRIEVQGGSVAVYVDNITFRADDDGQSVIPCGISYWNGPDATHYGLDSDGSKSIENAIRGIEVEIDDPFNIGTPPDWTGHCNDGNFGTDASGFFSVWAVISEQQISTSASNLYYTNGSTNNNVSMSQDNTYTGPGYLYYYKLYTGCNGESGAYDPESGLSYAFWFDFGSNMPNVYYQLNSSGIEKGGGVTSSSEYLAPGIICNTVLPVELMHFDVRCENSNLVFSWSTASEINADYFVIQQAIGESAFKPIAEIHATGNTNQNTEYQYILENPSGNACYYRLLQIDTDGKTHVYDTKSAGCNNTEKIQCHLFPNPAKNGIFNLYTNVNINKHRLVFYTLDGRQAYTKQINLSPGSNKIVPEKRLKKGIYVVSLQGDQVCKNFELIVR